mmetsp:Transcript_16288/g.31585  ORF Transcript_16288/g.31585 Transcript_16288/m.31585 type:complete len:449 (-) Transcript_16288:78-1424(-)
MDSPPLDEDDVSTAAANAHIRRLSEKEQRRMSRRLSTTRRRRRSHIEIDGVNPFQTDEAMDAQEWAAFIAGLIFIAPIRVIVFVLTIITATTFIVLSVAGCDLSKPLPEYRAKMQIFVVHWCSRALLACFGIYSVEVRGQLSPVSKARLAVLAPHSTPFDALISAAYLEAPSHVAKSDLTETFVGPVLQAMQTILVDRASKKSRKATGAAILARANRAAAWRRRLAIYPEGTCTNRSSLIKFRLGAFEPLAPIQPVVLRWDVGAFDPAWTAGSPYRNRIVFRCLARLELKVAMEFLPVMEPLPEDDASTFADRVRATMADALGVPMSAYSYPDMFLATIAAKRKVKPALILPMAFEDIERDYSDIDDVFEVTRSLLVRYTAAPDMDEDGRMAEAQFDAVKRKAAKDVGLDAPLQWDVLKPMAHHDDTISFGDFAAAHYEQIRHAKLSS